ncbi:MULTISPECIES: helix-turn-helix transcriptional regulator [unclassified Pseudonocardia]|jgi:transcriptional regulator with XRE-family HTH domain|uniref:helix-turn-helix domain-containing protein n=1 Tax=unclassified Pseudonocardia TaxID=2619320 RepID=UPI00095BB0EB|nr:MULTISPECIES: helix-turn-helix transcriptional regulator [unclassified Pseudonocardia]MBN9097613.1 helix-turn-helix domain-containing protein [Pseudonocardia sp.]OJY39924.1 MAG: transcriptional regulator [Pseudonocardia sp. 73-21]
MNAVGGQSSERSEDGGATGGGPTVLRIALGSQLRARREYAGLSREVAGDAIRASTAKISRLELGRVGFKERDVADLLTLYGVVDREERDQFLALARRANAPGWWHRYADLLPAWFETYLGLEQAASVIRCYELQFVPGLVQTRDYARAVTLLGHSDPEDVERRVDLRMRRQKILTSPGGPTFWGVVDEAALRRSLAGPDLMRAQLDHLIEVNRLPNVSLQIARLSQGGHPAAGGPFTILRFGEPDLPDIVYLEQLTSALYLDKRADVEHYAVVMDRLCAQVDRPAATESVLTAIRAEL